tara:strand:+ start:237 stop:539 length:303 start_codon:yes stop_codon:yes gene_type:complete
MRLLTLLLSASLLIADNSNAVSKASAALKAGLFKDALEHISIAQEENPKNPDIHRMKALLHEALDQPKKALESWEACLEYSRDKNMRREAGVHIENLTTE